VQEGRTDGSSPERGAPHLVRVVVHLTTTPTDPVLATAEDLGL
jgi:hypothetical protein